MKLCWEFLDRLRLSKPYGICPGGKLRELKGVPEYQMLEGEFEFAENCRYCGKDYMRRAGSKTKFCDLECKKLYTKWNKEWKKIRKYRSRSNRKKLGKDYYREYRRNYYNKESYNERRKKDPHKAKLVDLLRWTRNTVNKKGLQYNLDREWVREKLEGVCEKTQLEFNFSLTPRHPFAPSIDRINPNKGYTKDNCQMVVYIFNVSKNNFAEEDLYKMCRAFIKQHDHNK